MSDFCLTRAELREWSKRRTRGAIARWLKRERIAFLLDADDWPQVARELRDRRHGLAGDRPAAQHAEPDFAAIA